MFILPTDHPFPKQVNPCRAVHAWQPLYLLAAAINVLSPREKQIITLRFGLGGGKEQTQKEVADQLGISQSYISRLEKRIIRTLKARLESE